MLRRNNKELNDDYENNTKTIEMNVNDIKTKKLALLTAADSLKKLEAKYQKLKENRRQDQEELEAIEEQHREALNLQRNEIFEPNINRKGLFIKLYVFEVFICVFNGYMPWKHVSMICM